MAIQAVHQIKAPYTKSREFPDIVDLDCVFLRFLRVCVTSCVCPFPSYVSAAVALDQETNGGVRRFEVCDNIDLEMVLMEYESYHYVKFQKYPKLIRRTAELGMPPPLKQSHAQCDTNILNDTVLVRS